MVLISERLNLPNFFVAGVAKAGTTLMYHYLKSNPKIFLPKQKEPRYFLYPEQSIDPRDPVNKNTKTNWEDYLNLFKDVEKYQAVGECSGYFTNENALSLIKSKIPNAKFIVLLRDPLERAYSHFLYSKLNGYEPKNITFSQAIREKEIRYKNGWVRQRNYKENGLYGKHLIIFLRYFDQNKLKLILYEEFVENPLKYLSEIYKFLEVSPFKNQLIKEQKAKSGSAKFLWLYKVLKDFRFPAKRLLSSRSKDRIKNIKEEVLNSMLYKKPIKSEDISFLLNYYKKDIQLLKSQVNLNLNCWKYFE